jgi:hypothetical protein
MSKVELSFDSETKEISVKIDGKSVDNVSGLSYYVSKSCNCEDMYYCLYLSSLMKTENDIRAVKSMSWEWEADMEKAVEYSEEVTTPAKALVSGSLDRPKVKLNVGKG